ncbi:MAG: cob(I)yrinic acid a,c-diamide adenosyltransferase [Candidatus Cloacimonetes bacterium]|nr:cob(I)yrinic acid a,c-diamide adenosyltransferase [Candidatus Cloacimonadota bacterium]
MKIYTKTGDDGVTSLFTGERVSKNHLRLKAYGDLDELNSYLGLIVSLTDKRWTELKSELQQIQSHLFTIGGHLATGKNSLQKANLKQITPEMVNILENSIDSMQKSLLPLTSFVLPGGSEISSFTHIARTICRRVERHVVELNSENTIGLKTQNKNILTYINRLSDYLFILARFFNIKYEIKETVLTIF